MEEKGELTLFQQELEDQGSQDIKQVSLLAVGNKYFGQAFINESELLPKARFQLSKSGLQSRIEYELITKKSPVEFEYQVFVGPKSLTHLSSVKKGLKSWINFGFFDWLARPLLNFLRFFHSLTGNWGFAVILLTFFVRLCLLPLNISSYKSMKVMQKIQPQIQELRDKHKKDPAELNARVMSLMREKQSKPFRRLLASAFSISNFLCSLSCAK